eukprot:Tbor_TRINITY_DN5626_c0_g2::TRINITY_DN5626_c0_g2_i1::g.8135::m.8135
MTSATYNEELGVALCSIALDGSGYLTGSRECPLSRFAKDVLRLAPNSPSGDAHIQNAITDLSMKLIVEEQQITAQLQHGKIAKDKLKAELMRVEASIISLEKRKLDVETDKAFCRLAINGLVHFGTIQKRAFMTHDAVGGCLYQGRPTESIPDQGAPGDVRPTLSTGSTYKGEPGGSSSTACAESLVDLISVIAVQDIREESLHASLTTAISACSARSMAAWTQREAVASYNAVLALVPHLKHSRPPNLLGEIQILGLIAKRTMTQMVHIDPSLDEVLIKEDTVHALLKLLNSVNDDVKTETLDCLNFLAPEPTCQQLVARCGGVQPIVQIVGTTSSEKLLQKALIALWQLISSNDDIRAMVRDADGLRIVMELLYTDTMNILDNVCIAIGYLTRDEEIKKTIRNSGGLEKLVATLRHPSPAIQTKMAAAVWNCAADESNKAALRNLGAIPALIELLSSKDDSILENTTGALWNLAVDEDNKTEILHYGGIPALVRLLPCENPKVVESASGTLWNCSAVAENRPAIRNADGIPPLLALIENTSASVKTRENAAAAIRNCSIMDQNKISIRIAGGIKTLIGVVEEAVAFGTVASLTGVLVKSLAALWILTVNNDNKQELKSVGALSPLLALAEMSDVTPSILEKIFGTLRNYAAEKENRGTMLAERAVGRILSIFQRSKGAQQSDTNYESICAILWALIREDKVQPVDEGALTFLCSPAVIRSKTLPDTALEQAAGALSSLAMRIENRDGVRQHGVLPHLCDVLKTKKWKSNGAIVNAVLVLRNCTASNNDRTPNYGNVDVVTSCGGHLVMLNLIKEHTSLIVNDPKRAEEHEDISKEAALCLKNCVSISADIAGEVVSRGGEEALKQLIQDGSAEARKAAMMSLQSLMKVVRTKQ